jgi:hypothetical protein
MAFQAGRSAHFSLDGTDISGYLDSLSFSRDVATAETTNFGSSGNAEYVVGIESATISGSGSFDPTQDAALAATLDQAVVAWIYGPYGNTSGNVKYNGNAFVTNYSVEGGVGDKVSFSFTAVVDSGTTRGTF